MSKPPTVSVCIPTYKRSAFLKNSIASVLAQTFQDFELIVADNASTDDTSAVVNSFHDDRIRYIRHSRNIGVINNFNHCLEQAKGAYVTLFHDDDVMLPDNLRLKARALDEHPRAGFVYTPCHTMDVYGNDRGFNPYFGKIKQHDALERGHDFVTRNLETGHDVPAPSVMIRKECYARLGGFSERLPYSGAYEYWMRIALHYDVMYLAMPLIKYRMHSAWGTGRFTTMVNGALADNPEGQRDHFLANMLILEQAQRAVPDAQQRRRMETSARRRMTALFAYLVEQQFLAPGDRAGARRYILAMYHRFPAHLETWCVLRLMVKSVLTDRTVRRLKAVQNYLWLRNRAASLPAGGSPD